MSFTTNDSQQMSLEDNFTSLNERTEKFVTNSWVKGFADLIFPAIDES